MSTDLFLEKSKTLLVTGGAGYIGTHCLVEFLNFGFNVIVIDNFMNSYAEGTRIPSLERVEQITGKKVQFYKCDLLDLSSIENVFLQHHIDCVVHLAGSKSISESITNPIDYYQNNFTATLNLIQTMEKMKCYELIFASTWCVYSQPLPQEPISENFPIGNVSNPYARSKSFIEFALKDLNDSNSKWKIIILRYFNPIGAHESGLIGEDPKQVLNIMPKLGNIAKGKLNNFTIFGNNYKTKDGTCVRDYIHVMDLAAGHTAAIKMMNNLQTCFKCYNLGSGCGTSILELIHAFEKASNSMVPIIFQKPGSNGAVVESIVSNIGLPKKELKWEPIRTLDQMCSDFYNWQTKNPNGYIINSDMSLSSLTHNQKFDSNEFLYDPKILFELERNYWLGSNIEIYNLFKNSINNNDNFYLRPLRKSDYNRGFPRSLAEIEVLQMVSEEAFTNSFERMKRIPSTYYITLLENKETSEIIGSIALILEQKFINNSGNVGKIEDFFISMKYRGSGLGKLLMETCCSIGKLLKCYKIYLNCRDDMVGYYQQFGFQIEKQNCQNMTLRIGTN